MLIKIIELKIKCITDEHYKDDYFMFYFNIAVIKGLMKPVFRQGKQLHLLNHRASHCYFPSPADDV